MRFHQLTRYVSRPRPLILHSVRKIRRSRKLVIIGTGHKVGSTWLLKLIRDCCSYTQYPVPQHITQRFPQTPKVSIDLCDLLETPEAPFGGYIFKTHSLPPPDNFVSALPGWVWFVTMIRDPRDVIISLCYYLANLPDNQGGWGDDFRNAEVQERIKRIIDRGSFQRERLQAWQQCAYAHTVRYEQLLFNPEGELQRLLSIIGVNTSKHRIRRVCRRQSFKAQTGRSPGQADNSAFLRKGIAGDWKNYFNEEIKNAFKQNEQWNQLLVKMGYEKNLDW